MPIPVWPLDVRLKIQYGSGLEYGAEAQKSVTPMDGGNRLQRARYPASSAPVYLDASLPFNDVEVDRIISFYMNELELGTRPFVAPVLNGAKVEYHRVQFSMPSFKPVAETYNLWRAEVQFEIRGIVYIDPGTYWFIDYYGYEFGEKLCDLIQKIINVDLPGVFD